MKLIILTAFFAYITLADTSVNYHEHATKDINYAKKAATCLILGDVIGISSEVLQVYVARIRPYNTTVELAYHEGYTKGMLHGMAAISSDNFIGYQNKRIFLADKYYKLNECSTNLSV